MTAITTISTITFMTNHVIATFVELVHKKIAMLLATKYNPKPAKGIIMQKFERTQLLLILQFPQC